MGIQSGSVSLTRYRLLGAGRRTSLAELNELLAPHQAGLIDIDRKGPIHDKIYGWVRPLGLDNLDLPPAAHWDLSHCRLGDGYMLRARVEKRSVPSPLLLHLTKQTLCDIEAKEGKPPKAKERREIKETLKSDLMKRALPALSYVDGFWNEARRDLTLFTTSKASRELFLDLFDKTFAGPLGFTAVSVEPPLLGLSREEWDDGDIATGTLGRLSLTVPQAFSAHVHP